MITFVMSLERFSAICSLPKNASRYDSCKSSRATAFSAVGAFLYKAFRWMERQKAQDAEIDAIKKEQCVMYIKIPPFLLYPTAEKLSAALKIPIKKALAFFPQRQYNRHRKRIAAFSRAASPKSVQGRNTG